MKVLDILNHKSFHFNQDLVKQSSISISETGIDAKLNIALNVNEEVECIYYWYDHLYRTINPKVVNEINTALNSHDWDTFKQYFDVNIKTPYTLPKEIMVFTKNTNILIGHLDFTKETFDLIALAEYECG